MPPLPETIPREWYSTHSHYFQTHSRRYYYPLAQGEVLPQPGDAPDRGARRHKRRREPSDDAAASPVTHPPAHPTTHPHPTSFFSHTPTMTAPGMPFAPCGCAVCLSVMAASSAMWYALAALHSFSAYSHVQTPAATGDAEGGGDDWASGGEDVDDADEDVFYAEDAT